MKFRDPLPKPVVFDLGTGFIKVGFGTPQIPDGVVPNTVALPNLGSDESIPRSKLKHIMITDETTPVREYLDLAIPIEHSIANHWEGEKLALDYVWKQQQ
jgi:actin-related protein 2